MGALERVGLAVLLAAFLIVSADVRPSSGDAGDAYAYRSMRPVMAGNWYFLRPGDVAVDSEGYVYVADTENHRIRKYSAEGRLITQWGGEGGAKGLFYYPGGIATDRSDAVYVADTQNHRIQKFTTNGKYLNGWGEEGDGPCQFNMPRSVAVDPAGNVYVADAGNGRIQKFTSDGDVVPEWGGGDLGFPVAVAVDRDGFVYAADQLDRRILKFTPEGDRLAWGVSARLTAPAGLAVGETGVVYVTDVVEGEVRAFGPDGAPLNGWAGDGGLDLTDPAGVAVHNDGRVYVADTGNNRIQIFSGTGRFLSLWGLTDRPGHFNTPHAAAVDSRGVLYVADTGNDRIQRFAADGVILPAWGGPGDATRDFNFPTGISVHEGSDGGVRVLVADTFNHRIQVLDGAGAPLIPPIAGGGGGELSFPRGVAADRAGNIYVADTENHRVRKFDSGGGFIRKWGREGSGDGEFDNPRSIVVSSGPDGVEYVYVSDMSNHRIQRFTTDGEFVDRWGAEGTGPGAFSFPVGLAAGREGAIFVADMKNSRIQKFSSDGDPLARWGELGSNPGQLNFPRGVAVGPDGRVYVADSENHRIQIFAPTPPGRKIRAVIVAGGGPYPGNRLWDATRMCANFAYRALIHRGIPKVDIRYFSADGAVDLDNNGRPDDVAGPPTLADLEAALTAWAGEADDLVLYLVDHGVRDRFRLSPSESLLAATLDEWLDRLQDVRDIRITVVQDACESGGFLAALTPPPGAERIVIGSAGADESAYFVSRGAVSFSGFFWSRISAGETVGDAFATAAAAISAAAAYQHPELDDTGDGTSDAADGEIARNRRIGPVEPVPETAPLIDRLTYERTRAGGGVRIRAEGVADPDGDGIARVWGIVHPPAQPRTQSDETVLDLPTVDLYPSGAGGTGLYEAVYDGFHLDGDYRIAVQAMDNRGQASTPRSLTVAADHPPVSRALLIAGPGGGDTLDLAENALRFQGYPGSAIRRLAPSAGQGLEPTPANIADAILQWATDDSRDLALYLAGDGDAHGLELADGAILLPTDLDAWLDAFQAEIAGPVVIVCDGFDAEGFLAALEPDGSDRQVRVRIAGNPDSATGAPGADDALSFSRFFWPAVANGADLYTAFTDAAGATGQSPALDDNGNAVFNEKTDGQRAREIRLGHGIRLTDGEPATVITPPSAPPVVPDAFEDMDAFGDAHAISPGGGTGDDLFRGVGTQERNFHAAGDEDWATFFGRAGQTYVIETDDPGPRCDTVITLLDGQGNEVAPPEDRWRDNAVGRGESIFWDCPADGIYYVRVESYDPEIFGQGTDYRLSVYVPVQGVPGLLTGRVVDADGNGVAGARIVSDIGGATAMTDAAGNFVMALISGDHNLTVNAPGFAPHAESGLTVASESTASETIVLTDPHRDAVADAGPDRLVREGSTVTLDGSGSIDPGNDARYLWIQLAGPELLLQDPERPSLELTTLPVGEAGADLSFQLILTDPNGATAMDDTDITVFDRDLFDAPDRVLWFRTATGREMGVRMDAGDLRELAPISADAVSDTDNRPWQMVYGLVAVQAETPPGGAAEVRFALPEPATDGERTYDPYLHDDRAGWRKVDGAVFNDARDGVAVTVTDGGPEDADGVENGMVEFRMGLGLSYGREEGGSASGGGGGGGGCFIDALPSF